MTGGGYKMAIINKMLWSQVLQHLVHQDSELEFNSLTNWQPVELSQNWSNVFGKLLVMLNTRELQ